MATIDPSAPGAPGPNKRLAVIKDAVLIGAIALAAGLGAWYYTAHEAAGAPPPPTSKLAPYSLPVGSESSVQPDTEIAFYTKRVAANPNGFMDLVTLANAYIRKAKQTGDPSYFLLADQAAHRSLAKIPDALDNMGAHLVVLHVMEARHQFKEAIALAKSLDAKETHRESLVPIYITAYIALGDPDQAGVFAKLLVQDEPSLESYNELGLVRYAQGKDDETIAAFAHGIQHEQPGQRELSAMARAWLARMYMKRGRLDDATDLLTEADRILPNSPVVMTLQGDLAMRRVQPASAQVFYEKAYTASANAAFVGMESRALLAKGDAAGAARLREAAMTSLRRDLGANDFGHRRDLITLLLEQRAAAADQEAVKLAQIETGIRHDPETMAVDAWALGRVGRWAEAHDALETGFGTGFKDAIMFARAAWIADHMGATAAAVRYRTRAQETDPLYQTDPGYPALAADGFKP